MSNRRFANRRFAPIVADSQRGEPEGGRKHLHSKKVFLCLKKGF